jgi:polyisoprenoid-binding protein YceI
MPRPQPPRSLGPVTLTDGTHRLGPPTGRLLLKTGRAGLGRRAGHDLTIEAIRWSGEAVVAVGDPDRSSVSVTVETGSLEVREGTGGIKALTDADRAEIRRTLGDKALLHTAKHPRITFRSTRITGTPQSFEITGDLTIKGRTHPVNVHAEGNGDELLRGWATVTQSTWGIKPYTAFLGALRLADEVRVEFEVTIAPA